MINNSDGGGSGICNFIGLIKYKTKATKPYKNTKLCHEL